MATKIQCDRMSKAIGQAGATMATPCYNCRWSNDKYLIFFTREYPNVEAAMAGTGGTAEGLSDMATSSYAKK
jgi:hypothetical protein